jgi:hypothetical protein
MRIAPRIELDETQLKTLSRWARGRSTPLMLPAAENRGILTGIDHRARGGEVAARRRSFSVTRGCSFAAR